MRPILVVLVLAILAGCGSSLYRDTAAGTFRGDLDVRWVKNDYFVFVPSAANPLGFERKTGEKISPGPMYTDGGSIPRFLWGVSGLSPWGYAPAYIVHDWLFEAQHCRYQPDVRFTFKDSVAVIAEALKAIMEKDPNVKSDFLFTSIVTAVSGSIAQKQWTEGRCKPPLAILEVPGGQPGELIMTIRFP